MNTDTKELLERVDKYLSLGYQRIKLKIKPGWDIEVVHEVRRRYPNPRLVAPHPEEEFNAFGAAWT